MTTYGNLNPLRGEELLIYVGTQVGNTVTFAGAPTLFNKSVTFGSSTDLITDKLPNLDDLGAPSSVVSAIDSISHTLTGSGSVHKTDSKRWVEWRDSGATKIVRWGTAGSDGYASSRSNLSRKSGKTVIPKRRSIRWHGSYRSLRKTLETRR